MFDVMATVIMNEEQVVNLIKAGQKGRSLRKYADSIGITAPFLRDIYEGRRSPGEKTLKHFGLTKTRRVIVEYSYSRNR